MGLFGTHLFQIAYFKQDNSMAVEDTWVWINLYKKQCLPVITWNEKYLSNQVVATTCILGKRFFAVAIFEGLWVSSFQTVKKL